MPLYGDILRANFFDLQNLIKCQIFGDLKPLKGFGINLFWSYQTLIYLKIPQKMIKQGGDH